MTVGVTVAGVGVRLFLVNCKINAFNGKLAMEDNIHSLYEPTTWWVRFVDINGKYASQWKGPLSFPDVVRFGNDRHGRCSCKRHKGEAPFKSGCKYSLCYPIHVCRDKIYCRSKDSLYIGNGWRFTVELSYCSFCNGGWNWIFNEKCMYKECIAIDYHSHPTFVHIIVVLNCVAVIVDKDNTPRWNPPTLTEVTPEVFVHPRVVVTWL